MESTCAWNVVDAIVGAQFAPMISATSMSAPQGETDSALTAGRKSHRVRPHEAHARAPGTTTRTDACMRTATPNLLLMCLIGGFTLIQEGWVPPGGFGNVEAHLLVVVGNHPKPKSWAFCPSFLKRPLMSAARECATCLLARGRRL
jgi:hypothetical protein